MPANKNKPCPPGSKPGGKDKGKAPPWMKDDGGKGKTNDKGKAPPFKRKGK